jgi:hypothetical protein
VSHKGLRLLTPALLALAVGANAALAGSIFYYWTLVAQGAFYAVAVMGSLVRNLRARVPLISVPYVICLLSWATVVAFVRFLGGRQSVRWERASA